jgi:serine/threonine-protein kinase HipA
MNSEIFVYVDLDGTPLLVGRLWSHMRRRRESATFEYDEAWLQHAERFALEPALQLGPGPFHTVPDRALFGAIGDSTPDRWGRVLMRRAERRRAQQAGEAPRTLREIDYLLMVDDEARQGALRFAGTEGGSFLAEHDTVRIPPLVELPRLLAATEHVIDEVEDDEDLRLLLGPGSSLGGARPKASVRDHDGALAFAKFPHKDDDWDTVSWEAVALALAAKAGITVPDWRIEQIAHKPVLILRRFDRADAIRIPFLSAMSMLSAKDNETRSYLEIADALRQQGAHPKSDLQQLWRRLVFTILISNTDDHLRNHGFLYEGSDGWILSPAYDLNPVPIDIKPRVLSTAIDFDDQSASLELAFDVAEYFELETDEARAVAAQVADAVSTWRTQAARNGLTKAQCDRMASAFEHDDLETALVYKASA